LKNRELLKADLAPPQGGPRVDAKPGGKELLGKNHEAASVSWTGRANPLTPVGRCSLWVGATGRSPDRPAPFCGSRSKPPGKGPARPMLFTQNLLAPGPQSKHPGIVNPHKADPPQSGNLPQ